MTATDFSQGRLCQCERSNDSMEGIKASDVSTKSIPSIKHAMVSRRKPEPRGVIARPNVQRRNSEALVTAAYSLNVTPRPYVRGAPHDSPNPTLEKSTCVR